MENDKKQRPNEDWLEDILKNQETSTNIGLDESVTRAVGLVPPGEDSTDSKVVAKTQNDISDAELMDKISSLLDDTAAIGAADAIVSLSDAKPEQDSDDKVPSDNSEDTFLSENTPEPETQAQPVLVCPNENGDAEENTDITTSDTVFFSPVSGTPVSEMDATQIMPGKEALTPAKDALTQEQEAEPMAPLSDIHAQNSLDPQEPVKALTPQELAEEESIRKQACKEARKQHRAERRAHLDRDETPIARNFFTKTWQVLRWGDGFFGIPHLLATAVWLVLIVAIGTSLGRTLWLCAADVLALGKTPHEITITIEPEDELPDVTEKLHNAGMIRYPKLFTKFAELTGKDEAIFISDEEPLTITFGGDHVYDYNALINALSYKGGSTVTLEVTIPEGYSCAQIFELLQQKGVCSVWALEVYCTEFNMEDYWFLQEIPQDKRNHKYALEGFLFPDTYEFYKDDEPDHVIEKFLENFKRKFSQRMIDKYVALQSETGLNLTLYEVMTMASMVEKEKAADLEGYKIASVFYNRLRKPSVYPFLDSDATINYAIDYYNKGELITDEQINASPYQTYTNPGLPPTPIANPGLSSIDAALEPYGQEAGKDQYYFFLLDRSINRHVFSVTLAEHEQREKELGYK